MRTACLTALRAHLTALQRRRDGSLPVPAFGTVLPDAATAGEVGDLSWHTLMLRRHAKQRACSCRSGTVVMIKDQGTERLLYCRENWCNCRFPNYTGSGATFQCC